MKPQNYHNSIIVNISAAEVFDNICNVGGWWTENIEGSSKNPNDVFTVHFGETFVTFKITEAGINKIVWFVTDCNLHWLNDKKEWNNTKVVWQISIQNNSTQIDMTHIGLTPEVECYDGCKSGWNEYIAGSLFEFITKGKGAPQKKKEAVTN